MGVWSANFWDNDVALDTKESFNEYFKYGLTDEEGLTSVMRYCPEINDPDDGPIATIVIALQLWKIGRLNDMWLEKAKQAAELSLKNMKYEFDKSDLKKYEKSLLKIIGQITSPQPPSKEIKRIPPFKNIWQPGDVLAIKAPRKISVSPITYLKRYDEGVVCSKCDGSRSKIIKKYFVIIVIESINENIVTCYTRFNSTLTLLENIKKICEIPYIGKYKMQMNREVGNKEYILLGNYNDHGNSLLKSFDMPCDKLRETSPYLLLYEQVPSHTAGIYFQDYENLSLLEL